MTPKQAFDQLAESGAVSVGSIGDWRISLKIRGTQILVVVDDGKTNMAIDALAIPDLQGVLTFARNIFAELPGDFGPAGGPSEAAVAAMLRQALRK